MVHCLFSYFGFFSHARLLCIHSSLSLQIKFCSCNSLDILHWFPRFHLCFNLVTYRINFAALELYPFDHSCEILGTSSRPSLAVAADRIRARHPWRKPQVFCASVPGPSSPWCTAARRMAARAAGQCAAQLPVLPREQRVTGPSVPCPPVTSPTSRY
jgi:hypothetical protein